MAVSDLISMALKTAKRNAPELLTALGVSGLVTTSYLAAKASFQAASKLESQPPDLPVKEKAKVVWKLYIPAGLSGFATVACIVGSGRASGQRTASAVAAYSFTERAFTEYRAKNAETIGEGKERKLRDEIAQDRVLANPPSKQVAILGDGEVLCCDLRSNRYFYSTHEALQRAVNEINFMINHENYVSLSEFYVLIGLPINQESVHNGWTFEQLLELDYSHALTDDHKPCLTFRFNYVKPLHQ